MDRGVVSYTIIFTLGLVAQKHIFTFLNYPLLLALNLSLLPLLWLKRGDKRAFITISHLIFFILGYSVLTTTKPHNNYTPNTAPPQSNIITKSQKYIKDILDSNIPTLEERAIAYSLTLGDKSLIPYKLKKGYQSAGALHLLALSGLHTGIIYFIIDSLLFFLNFSYKLRRVKVIISFAILSFYAILTGLSPSVMRALFMIILFKSCMSLNRSANKLEIIALSALIMAIISPNNLLSIGAQLSFAAIFGILYLYPVCNDAYNNIFKCNNTISKLIKKLWDIIAISVCCQISTAPLVLLYFKNIPPYFLITNIVAMPLVTIILYLLVALIIIQPIIIATTPIASLLLFLLKLLNRIIMIIE